METQQGRSETSFEDPGAEDTEEVSVEVENHAEMGVHLVCSVLRVSTSNPGMGSPHPGRG